MQLQAVVYMFFTELSVFIDDFKEVKENEIKIIVGVPHLLAAFELMW